MELTRIRALRGPNLWSRHTAVETIVRCEPDERDISRLSGFETRLRTRFPQMGPLVAGGHDEPICLAHVLEVAALSLQAAWAALLPERHITPVSTSRGQST